MAVLAYALVALPLTRTRKSFASRRTVAASFLEEYLPSADIGHAHSASPSFVEAGPAVAVVVAAEAVAVVVGTFVGDGGVCCC